jgi:hypothetical protein
MSQEYFGSKDGKETAAILLSKAEGWTSAINTNGYLDKLRMLYAAYIGAYYNDFAASHQISYAGEQGELATIPVNHIRNLAQHILNMTCANRPAMEARAVNTDVKSMMQTTLANGILEYYMREKRLERYLRNAVEMAIVQGAGYVKMDWNATTGQIIDYFMDETTGQPDPNRPIYDGDIEFSNLSPFDVVVDLTKENQNHDWILVRTSKNKYDLAAKYPEYEKEIIALKSKAEHQRLRVGLYSPLDQTDEVYVYEFYHKHTDSMQEGRYLLFLDDRIILQDLPMPYRTLPVFRVSCSDIPGTPFGYTPLFDILPLQEAINSLYSTILTNQNAFGVQNLWSKPGNNLNVTSLAGGLNLVESLEKPEALNLTQTPPEVFTFLGLLERTAETLSGVNSVARGNPESSLKTGAALALVQSMALQFQSGLQQSYVQLVEDVGTALIKMLQDFASSPRLVAIVGKNNRTYMKQFNSNDISNIARVMVDVGNPLARSTAGRVQMADQLLQYQVIRDPQQYITLLNTGRLDALTEDSQHEMFLIRAENERIVDGEIPAVVVTDDHRQHILDHKAVLSDPDLRKDPELVARATTHIQMHIQQLKQADPQLLAMLGQQSLAPTPPPQGPAPSEVGNGNLDDMMMPPNQGFQGMAVENERLIGPGNEVGATMPNIPRPPEEVLPNKDMLPPQGVK